MRLLNTAHAFLWRRKTPAYPCCQHIEATEIFLTGYFPTCGGQITSIEISFVAKYSFCLRATNKCSFILSVITAFRITHLSLHQMRAGIDLQYLQAASDDRRRRRWGRLGADTKLVLRGYTANIRAKRKSCYFGEKILTKGLCVYVKRHTDFRICVP